MFEGEQAQRLMSLVALIFGLAPAIAPVVGGVLLQVGPWQLVFAFQVFLGAVLIVATLIVLPETHPISARVPLRVGEIVRGLTEVARQPAFHRLGWAGTLGFGAQFLYIGGAAIFVVNLLELGELDFWVQFVLGLGNGMTYPSIQLMTLDLVPTRRGAVMSSASFLALVFNAVAAVALTPYVATSTLGSLCWTRHCAATRPA